MAKWTIVFEDVKTDDGGPGVRMDRSYQGDPVDDETERWTPATLLAMFLDWAWRFSYFQRAAMKYEDRVVRYHIESSEKSNKG